ncbi:hypothetical protein WN943_026249 [Citrus x changshan-huyou]
MSGKIGKITRGSTSIKFWPPLVVVLVGSRPFSSLVANGCSSNMALFLHSFQCILYPLALGSRRKPVHLPWSLSFSTNFVFAIVPAQHPSLGADGIAFVVVPTVEYFSQPEILPGAYLGLSGNFSTIGWSENNILAISKQPVQ